MLKINKKVEYALMALKFMAQKNSSELTSAREICESISTPFDTTAKVLQIMNNNDLLNSVKGIKGGYSLARGLEEITYMELERMIEGRDHQGLFCCSSSGMCELYNTCNIVAPVEQLNFKLTKFLENLTLHDLLMVEEETEDSMNKVKHV